MLTRTVATTLAALVVMALPVSACHIELEAEKKNGIELGDTISVKTTVIWEHRRCVLEVDDVDTETSANAKVVGESGWEKVKNMTYENTYKIAVTDKGDVKLRVFRECSKKGVSENTIVLKGTK